MYSSSLWLQVQKDGCTWDGVSDQCYYNRWWDERKEIFYLKNTENVLRRQYMFAERGVFMFRPKCFRMDHTCLVPEVPIPHPERTEHAWFVYDTRQTVSLRSADAGTGLHKSKLDKIFRSIGIMQTYFERTATTLEANTIEAYPVHTGIKNSETIPSFSYWPSKHIACSTSRFDVRPLPWRRCWTTGTWEYSRVNEEMVPVSGGLLLSATLNVRNDIFKF